MESDDLAVWFAEYHGKNPQVYRAFCEMAREIRAQGLKRYGAKTIMERLRWESAARYEASSFKLSNNVKDRCSARYARMLIEEDPSFKDFFAFKELSSAQDRRYLSTTHQKFGGSDAGTTQAE